MHVFHLAHWRLPYILYSRARAHVGHCTMDTRGQGDIVHAWTTDS